HGVFVIPQVPSAEFLLMIRGMGYEHFVRRYFMNDSRARLQIPEIILPIRSELLEEIDVTRTPGPVVTGDTTEYWAEDYIVRSFVRLKDLLEQMEGITINEEGSVFHNGIRVVKALFNNVEYFSGSIR